MYLYIYKKDIELNSLQCLVGWLVGVFYNISTIQGYLILNPFLYI